MNKVTKVDTKTNRFEISRDLSIAVKKHKPGPPKRIDGMTVGIVTMDGKGEWHNIHLLETAQFVHITLGPNGDARPK